MHHKRRRHKAGRAGCLLCKPHKAGATSKYQLGHVGFGKLRREIAAASDLAKMKSESGSYDE